MGASSSTLCEPIFTAIMDYTVMIIPESNYDTENLMTVVPEKLRNEFGERSVIEPLRQVLKRAIAKVVIH